MEVPAFWPEKGHLNLNQYYYIKALVEKRNIEYALETGFHTGRSALAILNNCKNLKRMVSVDIVFVKERKNLLEEKFKNFTGIESDYESGPPDGCPIPEVTSACDNFYRENADKLSREKWHKSGKGFCVFTVKE